MLFKQSNIILITRDFFCLLSGDTLRRTSSQNRRAIVRYIEFENQTRHGEIFCKQCRTRYRGINGVRRKVEHANSGEQRSRNRIDLGSKVRELTLDYRNYVAAGVRHGNTIDTCLRQRTTSEPDIVVVVVVDDEFIG